VLSVLALLGIVWDLKEVPVEVLKEGRRGARAERTAH
jgi:hypothetical protein